MGVKFSMKTLLISAFIFAITIPIHEYGHLLTLLYFGIPSAIISPNVTAFLIPKGVSVEELSFQIGLAALNGPLFAIIATLIFKALLKDNFWAAPVLVSHLVQLVPVGYVVSSGNVVKIVPYTDGAILWMALWNMPPRDFRNVIPSFAGLDGNQVFLILITVIFFTILYIVECGYEG